MGSVPKHFYSKELWLWSQRVWEKIQNHIGLNLANLPIAEWWATLKGEGLGEGKVKVRRHGIIAYTAWHLWKQRNLVTFQQDVVDTDILVSRICDAISERWGSVTKGEVLTMPRTNPRVAPWEVTVEGWIKANFDGG